MCIVSNIGDYYGRRTSIPPWQQDPFYPTTPLPPVFIPEGKPPVEFTPEMLKQIKKLLEDAKKIDTVAGDKDCESEDKLAWVKQVEERLEALEKAKKPKKKRKTPD